MALLAGDLAVADTLLAEADSIMAATGDAPMSHARLRLAALQGSDAEALITASIQDGTERGEGVLVRHAEDAAATLYAGLGRYDDALAWAQQEVEHNPHAFYMTALPELVEAAVRCDEPDEARRAVDALCEKTQASGTAWARGVEARSRALISEGDDADALYREAISLLGESRLGVESARAQLLYGEWLRRQNRRVDAREQLRAAHEAFAAMGAEPFAERAERELKATGETVRKRSIETRDELTPQEAQIARLAAERLTNAEIAAQLFLSPRTVEWHLRKVFLKLGDQLPQTAPLGTAGRPRGGSSRLGHGLLPLKRPSTWRRRVSRKADSQPATGERERRPSPDCGVGGSFPDDPRYSSSKLGLARPPRQLA